MNLFGVFSQPPLSPIQNTTLFPYGFTVPSFPKHLYGLVFCTVKHASLILKKIDFVSKYDSYITKFLASLPIQTGEGPRLKKYVLDELYKMVFTRVDRFIFLY